tara:strand:- start:86 stop:238 length:153 start_codon:yes stop_codon:yes gene_type:complete
MVDEKIIKHDLFGAWSEKGAMDGSNFMYAVAEFPKIKSWKGGRNEGHAKR